MESYQLGLQGEAIAEKHLKQCGYRIREKNFHSQQGEIDLIAMDQAILAFIEVKYYSYRSFAIPAASVRKGKRDSIVHAARFYLFKNNIKNINCRFDVLAIHTRPDGTKNIELIKDAFKIN